jgi:hypothetical protein
MIGFDDNNHLMIQTWSGRYFYNAALESFILPLNIWTHVAATFSTENGLRLFVNETLVNMTRPSYMHASSSWWSTMTVGACIPPSENCNDIGTAIVPIQFRGKVDEMKIYSRELTIADIHALVNV